MSVFDAIGLMGHAGLGQVTFGADKIEWRDKSNATQLEVPKEKISAISFNMIGRRGYLRIEYTDKDWTRLDGFGKTDQEVLADITKTNYNMTLAAESVSDDGS